MQEIELGVEFDIAVPNNGDIEYVLIQHEWGSTSTAAVTPGDDYPYTPDSIGIHKFIWIDADEEVVSEAPLIYDVVQLLISEETFFEENPDLAGLESVFPVIERRVRRKIQNYTGQKFGPYIDKSLEIQGDGGDSLALPVRVVALTSVENNYGDDITELVEVSPNEPSFLQKSSQFRGSHYYEVKRDLWYQKQNLFRDTYSFTVEGSFGWEYVPVEVSDAASILIADMISSDDVVEMRRRGVFEQQIGDFSHRLNADQWGTTGNTEADNLLSAYMTMGFGLV